jgi:hypothetical protein
MENYGAELTAMAYNKISHVPPVIVVQGQCRVMGLKLFHPQQ